MLAGSSLPVTWRLPEVEIPLGTPLQEALAVYSGHIESYGIHALEMLQCMVERRRGGESGMRAVQCLEGEAVWQAAREGRWWRQLLDAARDRYLPREVVEAQRSWSPTQLEAAYAARPGLRRGRPPRQRQRRFDPVLFGRRTRIGLPRHPGAP